VGIRGLLLAANAFALAVPIVAIVSLRIFDDQLIRRTEAQLIGQSVLIGELWREEWLRQMSIEPDQVPSYVPPHAEGRRYFPIEPVLRLNQGVLPPTSAPVEFAQDRSGVAWRIGERVQRILRRAVRMNLSSARVLDTGGCIVASSGAELGACIGHLPEVQAALGGQYAAVLRHRISDESPPPLESISRRGRVRVYTATPILSGDQIIGVVRMARTAIDPGKALWFDRERLLITLAACALVTAGLSLFLSRTIARPLREITRAARGIAQGEGRTPFEAPRLVPDELRDLSLALDQMTTQLSDRAEYIADFATNVSHELKTPITGIRGAAELLSQQWEEMTDTERARFLNNIEQDSERMERLVTRLLHLARIQSAPESVDALDLPPFLEQLAESYGDRVQLRLGQLPEQLRIAPDHLESALRNLLDNALRHGGDLPVALEADTDGRRVRIRVRDQGPGISSGNRERIFDRFFTTERGSGGTGLGLAIARAVAETRGGCLTLLDDPSGTCFELTL